MHIHLLRKHVTSQNVEALFLCDIVCRAGEYSFFAAASGKSYLRIFFANKVRAPQPSNGHSRLSLNFKSRG